MSWKTISYTPASIGITKFFNTDHDDDKNDLELLGKLEYNLDPDTDLDKKEIESLKYTVDGTAYFYLSDINKKRAKKKQEKKFNPHECRPVILNK